jgi:hypothetical protein
MANGLWFLMDKAKGDAQNLYNKNPNQVPIPNQALPMVESNWQPDGDTKNAKVNNFLRFTVLGILMGVPK